MVLLSPISLYPRTAKAARAQPRRRCLAGRLRFLPIGRQMTTNTFETHRLRLAPPTLLDFEESAQMWGDAEVARYIGGTPSTRGEAWGRLHRYVGHWALLDYGYWTVRERASDRFVGEVGFADFRRGLGPAFDDHPECGWALAPWAQGNGYATEAILGALDWAVLNLQADRTVCMIHPDNQA